ncbi:hypothetical protein [Rhodopseudomonas palustris]|uniref:hypothetical protein n=1 Tax=Rhodopseudomonas palustris TaxID=1076 RepID=UPI0012ED0BF1
MASLFAAEPGRYARRIDTANFDDVIKILLYDDLYWAHFEEALDSAYSGSRDLARSFLRRMRDIRNKLAHGGVCSTRDYEKAVCYSNDLVESIMEHLKDVGMERTFNVPTFIRVWDNLGNDFHLTPDINGMRFIDVISNGRGELNVGDRLTIEVDVDPSFENYTVEWMTFKGDLAKSYPVDLTIALCHVGQQLDVRLQLRSDKQWHRLMGGWDDMLDLRYRVLPPI